MTLSSSAERHDSRRCSIFRVRWLVLMVTAAMLGLGATSAGARMVRYHGYRLAVPSGWPVYQLGRQPSTCVRFDRHALYLGTPGARQNCPAHAVGRTEAVLISPAPVDGRARRDARLASAAVSGLDNAYNQVTLGSSGLVATATWSHDRGLVSRILGRRMPAARGSRSPARSAAEARSTAGGRSTAVGRSAAVARTAALARAAAVARSAAVAGNPVAHAAQAVYTGLGFDACSTPSTAAMAAWSASPFRAAGVYIGGVNSACAQPNLTPAWVSTEAAAGWHLILTYVGYQGAGACGGTCATIDPGQASLQGVAAADDAVSRAQSLGIPSGNPIYDDMEQYSGSSSNAAAVLAYLSGWTSELHAAGYLSGVYSSASSAVTDLVRQQGTGYIEPDDIWIGDWNGLQSTSDGYVPSGDWVLHQRVHQYSGAHNDSYGGVTLNIDSDYVDAATADTGAGPSSPLPVVPDGTFVQEAGLPTIYRVAGGAPLPLTSWSPYGGPQPVTTLTPAQFGLLAPYPADGTFVQTTSEENYRFVGGAPVGVSTWSVFGGIQPYIVVDAWAIENAGNPLAHVALAPADATVVRGLPSNVYWVFCGGQRSSVPATASAVEVDDVGLAAFAQGANSSCLSVHGAGALQPPVVKHCVIPRLKHLRLPRANRVLRKANCRMGQVREPRHIKRNHTLHVFGQSARPGSQHATRYHVNLWVR